MRDVFRAPAAARAEARRALRAGTVDRQLARLVAAGRPLTLDQARNAASCGTASQAWVDRLEQRAVDLTVPKYIRDAAKRGVDLHRDDLSGKGIVNRTLREASDMARGHVTPDKVIRANAWQARHAVDLTAAKNNDPNDPGYPGPGAVAHLLWGIDPLDPEPARRWFATKAEAIKNDRQGDLMAATRTALRSTVPDSIMAADAAIDAAQTLLKNIDDPTVTQAYYLLCAADAALEEIQDAFGLVDPDDDDLDSEPDPADPAETGGMVDMVDMGDDYAPRHHDVDEVEARRGLIERADKATFNAELRADGNGTTVRGYAVRWNVEADGLSFREQFAPGAFTRSLERDTPVFLLVNHDADMVPLASTKSGTLRLRQDDLGLAIEADLDPANPRAQELMSALSRGDIDKMSFAFSVDPDGQTRSDGLRTVTSATLHECSVVTWPAYSATSVGLRSAEDLERRRRRLTLLMAD